MGSREGKLAKQMPSHPEVQAEYDRRGRCLSSSGNPTKSSNPTTGRSTPSSGGGFCAASSRPTGAACAGGAVSRDRHIFIGPQAPAGDSNIRLFSKECYELARLCRRASSFNQYRSARTARSISSSCNRNVQLEEHKPPWLWPEHAIHLRLRCSSHCGDPLSVDNIQGRASLAVQTSPVRSHDF